MKRQKREIMIVFDFFKKKYVAATKPKILPPNLENKALMRERGDVQCEEAGGGGIGTSKVIYVSFLTELLTVWSDGVKL